METLLKICRFDPEQDPAPYFQEFAIVMEGTQTVLDALLLAWQQDPSLAFRRSCRAPFVARAPCASTGARPWPVRR